MKPEDLKKLKELVKEMDKSIKRLFKWHEDLKKELRDLKEHRKHD